MVPAACWPHARRKAFDAVKLNPNDRAAMQLVASIDELFAVDAVARDAQLGTAIIYRSFNIGRRFRRDSVQRVLSLPYTWAEIWQYSSLGLRTPWDSRRGARRHDSK